MKPKLKISHMTEADLPEVMELERETFSWPWSEESFIDEIEREFSHTVLARDENGRLIGFICFWALLDEAHILNLAVKESFRRKGVGTTLALEALRFALEHGARSATLEVREKNTAAITIYKKLGFVCAGIRKNYYDSPRDNAVIMWHYDIATLFKKSP